MTLVPSAPPCGEAKPGPRAWSRPMLFYSEPKEPSDGNNAVEWREGARANMERVFLSVLSPVVALTSLVTQLITLVLRRFIALHSNCTNAPDFQTAFMTALLRQRGGCLVIRDGIPARSKGCAKQGRTVAERGNHKLQPFSSRLLPFRLSYMNANALRRALINTVIATTNMAWLAEGECR